MKMNWWLWLSGAVLWPELPENTLVYPQKSLQDPEGNSWETRTWSCQRKKKTRKKAEERLGSIGLLAETKATWTVP